MISGAFADAAELMFRPFVWMVHLPLLLLLMAFASLGLGGLFLLELGDLLNPSLYSFKEREEAYASVSGWIVAGLVLGIVIAWLWATAVTIRWVGAVVRQEPLNFGAMALHGLRKIVPLFLFFITFSAATGMALEIGLILLASPGYAFMTSIPFFFNLLGVMMPYGVIEAGAGQLNELIELIAFLELLIVPWAFYFTVKSSLGRAAVVLDDDGPISAIGTSWDYTEGYGWWIFLFGLLFNTGMGIVGFLLRLIPWVGPALSLVISNYLWTATFTALYLRLAHGVD